jgi:hypothetical protein
MQIMKGILKRNLLGASMICLLAVAAQAESESKLKLVTDGKSNYRIYQEPASATLPEKTAAEELKTFLKKVTKADFAVTSTPEGRFISVGRNAKAERFIGKQVIEALGEEEFIIKSSPDGNIYIVGGRPRGTLYGVFHLLDNLTGIKWLTYDYTFIPEKPDLSFPALDIREKPAFKQRYINMCSRHPFPVEDSLWKYRNRYNYTAYQSDWYQNRLAANKVPKLKSEEYGINLDYSLPSFCHTMPRLVPAKKYFKQHPEWWEEINGKRVNCGAHSAMCMSNKELIKETAQNAIKYIEKRPNCKYVSISEADTIKEYCQCPKCRELIKKYGAKSGLLLNFVNQVAEIIHKKYPDMLVTTLAYIHSEKPPIKIKAGKNILIRLCMWKPYQNLPYNNPLNKPGVQYFSLIKKWRQVSPLVGIWDYVTAYFDNFIPHANLQTMVPNLKAFHDAGIEYFLAEADHNEGNYRSGESAARIYLISRGLWNPNASTQELLKEFTTAYFGPKAGAEVLKYWNFQYQTNLDAKYMGTSHGGHSDIPPHLKLRSILKSYDMLKKAFELAEKPVYKKHVKELMLQLDYFLLLYWKEYAAEAAKLKLQMPGTFDQMFADFSESTAKYVDLRICMKTRKTALEALKKAYYRDFTVTASRSYGSKADCAYDGNLRSIWNGGGWAGWLQLEYNEPRTISEIHTTFNWKDKSTTYEISGSLDGKNWFKLVPKRQTTQTVINQQLSAYLPVVVADDKFAPREVRFVKTRIFKSTQINGKKNWVVIREQVIK